MYTQTMYIQTAYIRTMYIQTTTMRCVLFLVLLDSLTLTMPLHFDFSLQPLLHLSTLDI